MERIAEYLEFDAILKQIKIHNNESRSTGRIQRIGVTRTKLLINGAGSGQIGEVVKLRVPNV